MKKEEKEQDDEQDTMSMGDIKRALVRLARRVDQPNGLSPAKAFCLRSIYESLANIEREERKTWWQSRVGVLWEERQKVVTEAGGEFDS